MVVALTKNKPNIAADMDKIIAFGDVSTIFPLCEKILIDYAVMEQVAIEGIVFSHPADFGWSDLGNWQSLHEKLEKTRTTMLLLAISSSLNPTTMLSTWRVLNK